MPQLFSTQTSTASRIENADAGRIASTTHLEGMVHDLRQPLSVIESLAYYLEMTSRDELAAVHLRRIQTMVVQANRILREACGDC